MKTVCVAIPPLEIYPHEAVTSGLLNIGLQPAVGEHAYGADMLVTWSPWNHSHRADLVTHYKAAGRPVIVVENGWLSPVDVRAYYQVALDGWNGTGRFPAGGPERWRGFGMVERPWTDRNGYALVIGQRGHPHDARTAPVGWHETFTPRGFGTSILRRARDARRSLDGDFLGASECHVWTSNVASWAVLAGVPVIQHGPNLMVSALASKPGEQLFRGDRQAELERLAWGQWTEAELREGVPFARVLAA